MKDEHVLSKQPITNSGMQTIDSGLSIAPDFGNHITPLSENVHPENTPGNLNSFSRPPGVLPHHCTENRTLQPNQYGSIIAFPPCKSEMLQPNGCVGSAALKHEVQYLKHNSESSTKVIYLSGNVPPHIQLSSSNSAVWPGPATSSTSKEVDLPTMKVPLDVTPFWIKCAIHVCISHMIKSYQEKEQQHTLILPSEDSKSRDRSESCVLVNNERAGLQSRLNIVASGSIYGSTLERSKHAGTNEISCSRRLVSAHISSVLSEYRQKQSCDFLSLSTNGDAGSIPNGLKAPVQLHSPFFHSQVTHHSLVPFPVSHVPYVPPYPEKLVALATKQVPTNFL
ncbi:hypothetical protein GW17_00039451 [Ensete ventricosum]|nr:hypothetical protein GW17_00039451 [Ensete ventricosum]